MYLCVEQSQSFSRVQRDEHLHQELLVLGFQRQREPVNDTGSTEKYRQLLGDGTKKQQPEL